MEKLIKNPVKSLFLFTIGSIAIILIVYSVPPIQERVDYRIKLWTADINYRLNPPEDEIFVPQDNQDELAHSVSATLLALQSATTPTQDLNPTLTPEANSPTQTPTSTPTPTITPTSLPNFIQLEGIKYQHQHQLWNYCGPATLVTSLSYWGWQFDRLEAGAYLRGSRARVDDKNVMPYEMENFVREYTDLRTMVRMGGNIDLLKALLAAGFPVTVEKDDNLPNVGWLGHYLVLYGYDEQNQEFISMDAYHGEGTRYNYEKLKNSWRAFNFIFLVFYPQEKETEVFDVLGNWVDEAWAAKHALEIAQLEAITLNGLEQYFAWFNIGTSNNNLQSYFDAAKAYDQAFSLYRELPKDERPWRILWYQTGPYWAYYYTGRYHDVLNLADQTLDAISDPILEESFYWRALAKEAIGDWSGALADMKETVRLNPNFGPGIQQLERMQGNG